MPGKKYCNFLKKTRICILIKIYKIDQTEHWKILNFSNKKMDWHGSHRSDGYWLFPKWFVTDKYVTELQHRQIWQLFGWDCNMYFVYMWKCENFLACGLFIAWMNLEFSDFSMVRLSANLPRSFLPGSQSSSDSLPIVPRWLRQQ